MGQLQTYITNFINGQILPLAVTAIVAALVAVGFGLVVGTQRLKEWAKGHIFSIVIGGALIYCATYLAQDFARSFGF